MERQKIFANVELADDVILQDWVVIGQPPPGATAGQLKTTIAAGSIIRSHTVIYAGSRFGPHFQTGHRAVIGPGMDVAEGCSIGTSAVVAGYVQMLEGARIHGLCTVGPFALLQAHAWVGPYCYLDSRVDQPIVVGRAVRLGAKVYVPAGLRVGEQALVGAGAVLTRDVPPYRLTIGNPGRAVTNIAALSCPYQIVEQPYEPDPPIIQEQVKRHHRERPLSETPGDTWRHTLWRQLGSPTRTF